MKVKLLEKVRTVVGIRNAGVINLPQAEAMRLIEEGKAVLVSPEHMSTSDVEPDSFLRENRMIKSFIKS